MQIAYISDYSPKGLGSYMSRSNMHHWQGKFESYIGLTASRNTAVRYSKALDNFFQRFTDKKDPTEFNRVDVEDYKILRLRDGVSNKTVNYEVQVVRGFWNWLIRMDVTSYNPASTSKRLKEKDPVRESLTEEEQLRLYDTAAIAGNLRDRLLVAMVLSTGLRAETLVQMDRSDCDFEAKVFRIPATKMKAGRNHEVPMRDDVEAMIKELPDGRFFEGWSNNAKSLSYRFNRLLARSGCKLRGLRIGRRTFATTLLRRGSDLRLVQDLLGHRNISTTSRYLTPADAKTTKAAIDGLPRPNPSKGAEDISG